MPAPATRVSTPGLLASSGPVFGDSGIGTDGVALPGLYLDLEQDSFHYYAIRVPERNDGVLRTELIAYNGDPNLYLRRGAPPSITGEPVYDRALTNAVGTEYGHWVPLDGRTESRLAPGLWYLAVHTSGGANVRYRLKAAVVEILDLPFDHPTPAPTDPRRRGLALLPRVPARRPDRSLGRQSPPGRGRRPAASPGFRAPGTGTNGQHRVTSANDSRNHGACPRRLPPGTHRLTQPPLRPGTPYFLGVRALTNARFSVASAPAGAVVPLTGVLPLRRRSGRGNPRTRGLPAVPGRHPGRRPLVPAQRRPFRGHPLPSRPGQPRHGHFLRSLGQQRGQRGPRTPPLPRRMALVPGVPLLPHRHQHLPRTPALPPPPRRPGLLERRLRPGPGPGLLGIVVVRKHLHLRRGQRPRPGRHRQPGVPGRLGPDLHAVTNSLHVSGLALDPQGRLVLESSGAVGQSCRVQGSTSLHGRLVRCPLLPPNLTSPATHPATHRNLPGLPLLPAHQPLIPARLPPGRSAPAQGGRRGDSPTGSGVPRGSRAIARRAAPGHDPPPPQSH